MCFKNLPIEFDAQGKARLERGTADPYSLAHGPLRICDDRERIEELFEDYDSVRTVDVDRGTRVAEGIVVDLHAVLDLVDQGCAPELAVRIVAPLEWKSPTDERPQRKPK